jgi:predicted nucleotidyltransferase
MTAEVPIATLVPVDIDALIARLSSVIAEEPRVAAAWLFGSAARGQMGPRSDVDDSG